VGYQSRLPVAERSSGGKPHVQTSTGNSMEQYEGCMILTITRTQVLHQSRCQRRSRSIGDQGGWDPRVVLIRGDGNIPTGGVINKQQTLDLNRRAAATVTIFPSSCAHLRLHTDWKPLFQSPITRTIAVRPNTSHGKGVKKPRKHLNMILAGSPRLRPLTRQGSAETNQHTHVGSSRPEEVVDHSPSEPDRS
jgi:hypothetical protein